MANTPADGGSGGKKGGRYHRPNPPPSTPQGRSTPPDGLGRHIPRKKFDKYRINEVRRLVHAQREDVDVETLRQKTNKAIKAIKRSKKHGTFNPHDEKIAYHTAHNIKTLNQGDRRDIITTQLARRLRHAAGGGKFPDQRGDGNKGHGGKGHGGKGHGGHGGHGGKGHGGKGKGSKGLHYKPDFYTNNPTLRRTARDIVGQDTNEQLQAIRRVMQGDRRQGQHAADKIRNTGKRTRGDLRHIFGEVADYTRAQNQNINEGYGNLLDTVSGNNNANAQANAAMVGGNRSALTDELSRLGIEGAGVGRFDTEAGFNASQADQANSDFMNNLRAQRTGANAVGHLLNSTIGGERASQIGQSYNSQNDALEANRNDVRDDLSDLRQQALDVVKNRGGLTTQLLLQLQDQDYNRWAEQSQNNFLNQMSVNAFNLDVDKMNSSNQWNRQKYLQQLAASQAIRSSNQIKASTGSILSGISGLFGS